LASDLEPIVITGTQHGERMVLRDRFRDVLTAATKQRHLLVGVITASTSSVYEWVLYERLQMLLAVNAARQERDLPLVMLRDIERMDRLATGHVDWLDKLSFYCAELATDEVHEWANHKGSSEREGDGGA
jgi:hypothetical protein